MVTVVMPVYNGSAYVCKAIQSVLGQTYANFELIVVDDCSTDDSARAVEQLPHDDRVVFMRNARNVGVAATRNRAIAASRGEFVTFLDQDDVWLPGKLALQVAKISERPELGLLHAEYARIDTAGHLLPAFVELPETRFGCADAPVEVRDVFAEIFVSNDIQPLTAMVPRRVLDEVGHFDPALSGVSDYELWLRIALRYPIGHLRTIVGYWRAHPLQQSRRGYEMLMKRITALEKILARFPEAKARVPRAALRRRMHSMYGYAANENMFRRRDFALARHLFARALRYEPWDADSAAKWLYCSLPESARDTIRRVKSALPHRRG